MNDWSNDNLQPGDLVRVRHALGHQPYGMAVGLVVSLNKPPVGSLQIYDAQILIEGHVVSVPRHKLHKITDDSAVFKQLEEAPPAQ